MVKSVDVTIDGQGYSINENNYTTQKSSLDKRTFSKLDKMCMRENHDLYVEIKKTAEVAQKNLQKYRSISKVLTDIAREKEKGGNIKKYTIYIRNNNAVLCKNSFFAFLVRLFGGVEIGRELPNFFNSEVYKENRMDEVNRMLKPGSFNQEGAERAIWTIISDYEAIAKYPETSKEIKDPLVDKFNSLVYAYFEKESEMEPKLSAAVDEFYVERNKESFPESAD